MYRGLIHPLEPRKVLTLDRITHIILAFTLASDIFPDLVVAWSWLSLLF